MGFKEKIFNLLKASFVSYDLYRKFSRTFVPNSTYSKKSHELAFNKSKQIRPCQKSVKINPGPDAKYRYNKRPLGFEKEYF